MRKSAFIAAVSFLGLLSAAGYCENGILMLGDCMAIMIALLCSMAISLHNVVRYLL